jgi:hypothetical protein
MWFLILTNTLNYHSKAKHFFHYLQATVAGLKLWTSKNIDCLTARTACLVCFISTVNSRSKKRKEKKPIMSCASSGHITKLKQSIFAPFDIYDLNP